jgi:hypothetical protein
LDAIRELSTLVETTHNFCSACSTPLSREHNNCHPGPNTSPGGQFHTAELEFNLSTRDQSHTGPFSRIGQAPSRPCGLETILSWDALSHLNRQRCFFAGERSTTLQPSPPPKLSVEQLCQLEAKYIDGVHSKNPVLNLNTLHQLVLDVAENGLDWSTRTCLVCLVSAIGALTQQYQNHHLSPDNQVTPGAPHVSAATSPEMAGTDPDLALQFWDIAAKRLGLAIGQRDAQAVQCLCLAGIWYMHQLEPMQAWQYFNLAASAWYAINLVDHASSEHVAEAEDEGAFSAMQALYFTIWKSICELRLELDVPGTFDHVGLPYDFPLAPGANEATLITGMSSSEHTWYYYLSDIAVRHHINRIINELNWSCNKPSNREVQTKLSMADALEAQLEDWRTSLPVMFHFDVPNGIELSPHSDDMTQILRHRYLACKEIVGRCFLWLCLETSFAYDEYSCQRALAYASQCLQYCMLKLSQVAPHRHQGTWFGLRNLAAATLTLCAVDSAKRKGSSRGAHQLDLPDDWRERANRGVEVFGPLWDQSSGGAKEIGLLMRSALSASRLYPSQMEGYEASSQQG